MTTPQMIVNSNNNFLKTLDTKQKMQNENNKTKAAINSLKEVGDKKGSGGGDGSSSALYAILLAMNNMMDANMQSMQGSADHLAVCNTQIQKNDVNINDLNSQLGAIGQSGSLQEQASFTSSLQVDNTKLNGIQMEENLSVMSVKNTAQFNQNDQVQAQAVLNAVSQIGHTKNN